jgi:hypothetical protein
MRSRSECGWNATRSRGREVDEGADAHREADLARSVRLRDDDAVAGFDDGQVAGLVHARGELAHPPQRVRDQVLERRMPVRELEDAQREDVAVGRALDRDVAAVDEAGEHAEDLADGALERARDLGLRETLRAIGEELEDVESFFESRGAVARGPCR